MVISPNLRALRLRCICFGCMFIVTISAPALASFNYSPPDYTVIFLGVAAGVTAVVLLAMFRSILVGVFGGAIACAAIAFYVTGHGVGDMTSLHQMVNGALAGVAGAIAGGAAAAFTKRRASGF